MSKIKIFIIGILFLTVCNAFAKINIAVLDLEPIGIERNFSLVNSDILREALLKYSKFNLIEREKLENVIKEQNLQTSGLVKNSVNIGNLVGAKKIISGKISNYGGKYVKYMVSIKIVDVESGSIDIIKNFEVRNIDHMKSTIEQVAFYISNNIRFKPLLFNNKGEWFIPIGQNEGVNIGDIYTIFKSYSIGRAKNQFKEELPIALCEIENVYSNGSKIKIISKKEDIKKNNTVKKGNYLKEFSITKKGKIIINSLPNGAKIYINGNFIGQTPKNIDNLLTGIYIIELRKGGYAPYKGKIHLTQGRIINVKKELKEVVELKDLISDINVPRQKTDHRKALLLGVIPGAGGIYNGYPKKGIATILGTIMPLMGTLLANNNISTYESRLNDNPE
ncbi:PEGA domain-containing protein, partial [bacterium]|nr:PEGA domain-containing protein [bacterium]